MRVKLVDESNVNMRRVIRIGEKSVGITLPREWLNTLKMSVGDVSKDQFIRKLDCYIAIRK
jgi:hypothetical protein